MEVLYDRVAGLDVSKASVTVCVRAPGARRSGIRRRGRLVRRRGRWSLMRDWLLEQGVTVAAMERYLTVFAPVMLRFHERCAVEDQALFRRGGQSAGEGLHCMPAIHSPVAPIRKPPGG